MLKLLNTSNRAKETSLFFGIFYTVGIAGLIFPFSYELFLKLIPFALILSFVALSFFHTDKINLKSIILFSCIYLIGFSIEAIGVKTKIIFGAYHYGNSLGFKLFETPLIIGINWLFLVYTTSSVFQKFKIHLGFKIVLASLSMLIYDIVLEQVAPKMDMWHWKNETVPLQNYIAWFIIALFLNSLLKLFKINTQNKLALPILIYQFLFFVLLFIFLGKP